MTVQHRDISDPELHEPKGVSSAIAKMVYVATGGGTGVWTKSTNGFVYFENIASPYTLTYPATFTKIAPTTVAGGSGSLVTEATTARLTYTGLKTIYTTVESNLSVSQASGANKDIRFAIYKNGVKVNGSVSIITTTTAEVETISIKADVSLATGDYVEVYAQNDGASGDISVYTFSMTLASRDY